MEPWQLSTDLCTKIYVFLMIHDYNWVALQPPQMWLQRTEPVWIETNTVFTNLITIWNVFFISRTYSASWGHYNATLLYIYINVSYIWIRSLPVSQLKIVLSKSCTTITSCKSRSNNFFIGGGGGGDWLKIYIIHTF